MNTQTRVVIATVLSLLVFIGYDYFFMPKPAHLAERNRTVQSAQAGESRGTQAAPAAKSAAPAEEKPKAAAQEAPAGSALGRVIATVETSNATIEFDALGRISQVYLKDIQYRTEEGEELKLFNSPKIPKPLEIRFSDPALNALAFKTPYTVSAPKLDVSGEKPETITFTQNLDGFIVKKTITIFPDHHYDIDVKLSRPVSYFISPGVRPDLRIDNYTVHGAMVEESDGTLTFIKDGDAKGTEAFRKARIAVAFDRYYATSFYDFENGLNVVVNKDAEENPVLFIKEEGDSATLHGYIGPKEYKILHAIHPELTKIIEFGWFTFIATPMFKVLMWLHSFIPNWGWTIVLLTLLIRIILYPLTYKGMVSMHRLKQLQPKIKEIQAKYKGDPQKMNAHMMELYKKHKANPLGGCLPMILQIPVFFAIYRVLLNAIELKGAPWILWIQDLSVMDPYYVLPVLMGASMWLHQRVTPSNFTDPMQEKIFKWLPVVFTFFFVTFPAGLVLYWLTNNIFSVAQQLMINRMLEKHPKAE
ncbi:membrane protein insertase YidC [Hydrogenimonas urashimensis]|uniref:membrane protein insertase YidC n=1 Tax=Hydrogenimonas urashimensis TaxID=2740515 RepID=UPI001F2B9FE5|nr:membrane protein insertase YidC [Hydrogenimonas urashimensis]